MNIIEPDSSESLMNALNFVFNPKAINIPVFYYKTTNQTGFVEIYVDGFDNESDSVKIVRKLKRPNIYYVNGAPMSSFNFFNEMKKICVLPLFEEFFFVTQNWVSSFSFKPFLNM